MDEAPPADSPAQPAARLPRGVALRIAGIGFGAGLLNGLLGVGGGIVLVPGLIFLRNATAREAVSTSLGTVLCLATLALGVHLAISGLYFSLLGSGLLLAAGGLGSLLGGYLLNRVPQRWILYLFAAFTFLASINLILQGFGLTAGSTAAAVAPPLWSYAAIGAFAGLCSGMLGVGGGGIAVLSFATFYHTPILGGLPLALAINVVNAGSGVLAQRGTGHTHWRDVARMVPAALVGIAVGVGLAVVMPGDALKVLFAGFFIYMGCRLILRGTKA